MAEKKGRQKQSQKRTARYDIEDIFGTSPNRDKKPERRSKKYTQTPPKNRKNTSKITRTNQVRTNNNLSSQNLYRKKKFLQKRDWIYLFGVGTLLLLMVLLMAQTSSLQKRMGKLEKKLKTPEVEKVYVNPNTVFLGDSITAFYELDRYFQDAPYINQGVVGNTTNDILKRLKESVFDYQPKQLVMMIGTNDFSYTSTEAEDVVSNIEEIILSIQSNSPATKIFVESILPINDSEEEENVSLDAIGNRDNERIVEANELLKGVCKKLDVTFIDAHSKFTDEDGRLNVDDTKDGLHLSENGYQRLTSILKEYISE